MRVDGWTAGPGLLRFSEPLFGINEPSNDPSNDLGAQPSNCTSSKQIPGFKIKWQLRRGSFQWEMCTNALF